MSGWQNVLVSKCLGARISCSHNVWVSKRGVSKCPGVEMSGAEMSENPKKLFSYRAQLRPGKRLIHELKVPDPYFCTGLIGQAAHLASQYSIVIICYGSFLSRTVT